MNNVIGYGFTNQIQKTYLTGKYAKTLYETGSDKSDSLSPKIRNGVIISISDKAKNFFAKAQQVKYNHASPVFSKATAPKSVFEKVHNKKQNADKTDKPKKNFVQTKLTDIYDNITSDLEKGGFVVSGNLFETQNNVEKSAAEKLLEIFEIENERTPGSLVNVLV